MQMHPTPLHQASRSLIKEKLVAVLSNKYPGALRQPDKNEKRFFKAQSGTNKSRDQNEKKSQNYGEKLYLKCLKESVEKQKFIDQMKEL